MDDDAYSTAPWLKNYDKDVPSVISSFSEHSVVDFLENSAKKYGKRTAIYFQKRFISYSDVKNTVDKLAAALAGLGVKKGDVIAILIPNFPQYIFSFFAAMKLGAIVTACSVLYTKSELEFQINDCGAEIVIAWDQQLDKINSIRDRTRIRHIITTNVFDYASDFTKEPPEIEGTIQFLNLINKTKTKPPEVHIDPMEDLAVIQYTGGTTGLPKGAMLTHHCLISLCGALNAWLAPRLEVGKESALTNLPLFHIYGMSVCLNLSIKIGATIGLNPDPRDHKSLFEIIRDIRVSLFPGVPTMYMRLLEREDIKDYAKDLRSIKLCVTGGAAMPPEVLNAFEAQTGALILEGYGMTETTGVAVVNPVGQGKRKVGSIGIPIPNTQVKIVDVEDATKILPLDTPGELLVKGPQVMKGYWNKPEDTANQLSGGWLKTGDIVKMDADGFLFIVDRKKDMINISGFKVYPREVEDVLFEHDAVENCSVIGLPDPQIHGSEVVKAFIILKENVKESVELESALKAFCREHLAPYKVPKIIEFRKQLPESLIGKVLRKDLKDQEARKSGTSN